MEVEEGSLLNRIVLRITNKIDSIVNTSSSLSKSVIYKTVQYNII
jgi:hypothetical protein